MAKPTKNLLKKIKVIFKKNKEEVIAIFPEQDYDNTGRYFSCYSHMGQHSNCQKEYANNLPYANKREYEELKNELEIGIGYNLEILNPEEIYNIIYHYDDFNSGDNGITVYSRKKYEDAIKKVKEIYEFHVCKCRSEMEITEMLENENCYLNLEKGKFYFTDGDGWSNGCYIEKTELT